MARGGKREGAGRKPKINPEAKGKIGSWCTDRQRILYNEALEKKIELVLAEVIDQQRLLPDLSPQERTKWLNDPEGYREFSLDCPASATMRQVEVFR